MVRCTWDRIDSQVAEQTAQPTAVRAGDRVFSSNACTQIDEEPEYHDLGSQHFAHRDKGQMTKRLIQRLRDLGVVVEVKAA